MNLLRLWASKAAMIVLVSVGLSSAADLPTAKSIAAEMGVGWNLGNTLELNNVQPIPTKALFDSVKAAGFKNVRIPAAWDSHADQSTHVINSDWMAQVKTVVDYAIQDSLFVVLNIHWDGGWLQDQIDTAAITPSILATIKAKQGAYWRQIATTFKNYDRHLLFASTNEPSVKQQANLSILWSLHQIFIDTVRATGGNNASRTLVIQGPTTSIENTANWVTSMPNDKIDHRLMMEDHYYSPSQFCILTDSADWGGWKQPFYYWGKNYHSSTDLKHNADWGEESYVDSQFTMLKPKFLDQDIPILLGEFGVAKHTDPTGDNLRLAILSRRYFYNYVIKAALSQGIIPVAWDAGGKGRGTMTIFDRTKETEGAIYDLGLLNAIRDAAGLRKLDGDTTSDYTEATGNNSIRILYSAKDSCRGQVNLTVARGDMTPYDSILVRAYVKGTSQYDSAESKKNGYISLSLLTMSTENWNWREKSLGQLTMDNWKTYSIPVSTNQADSNIVLVLADPTNIKFFGLQAWSKAFRGAIYVDWIIFKSKNGTSDTVYNFDKKAPEESNDNVVSVELFPTADVPGDKEWETATTSIWGSSPVKRRVITNRNDLQIVAFNGKIRVSYNTNVTTPAMVSLRDLQGRTIWSQFFKNLAGTNELNVPNHQSGPVIFQIRQGSSDLVRKVISLY
jgi:hypothetical protein